MAHDASGEPLRCSFCGASSETSELMARAGTSPSRTYICTDCVRALHDILQAEVLTPSEDSNREPESSGLSAVTTNARLVGIELYVEDLERAKEFYIDTLGLRISDEEAGHFSKFQGDATFVCLERKGTETYPSQDKAVLFFEVADLEAAITRIGRDNFVKIEPGWAVLHDPEGHNILLLNSGSN